MIDVKDLAKALQGGGKLLDSVEQFLSSSYCGSSDLRYQRARYSAALARFSEAFPDAKKVMIARAPGRVNLIGEHTDYNGLPVLPIAICRDVVIIFSPRKDRRVNLVNTSIWFPPRSFDISGRIRPYAAGNWGNYAKASAQIMQEVSRKALIGMDACICGDIPFGSGLSSSSALVVAVATALAQVNNMALEKRDMAELLARGERYVGTEGGGMDQAISLLAEPKKALKIDFFPLNVSPVSVPEDYSFVVCNSLIAAEKSGAARDEYNRRVVECRLGVALLDHVLTDRARTARNLTMLAGLKNMSVERQMTAIDQLPDKPVSIKEAAKIIGIPLGKFRETLLNLRGGEVVKEPRSGFKVKQRVRHVLSEGKRVEQAVRALESGNITRFGELMNQSHESCARDYEISTPEVDALVDICLDSGAVGARLTGAGFGGSVIALVQDNAVPDFVSSVVEQYYHQYLPKERKDTPVSIVCLEDAIFPCKPCSGVGTLP